ncbi:N-acetyltransferase [Stutzerimonas nitrititolerans]|uniref:N-acetyltransferase n=1 Tax=Stutzerimonas nitrititolerans TaxID=2482751 RepID=A0AA41WLD2_9GAMM|nr:N-acetyltransferase [Stutzerimonas nitrititolerans]MCO7544673.1 N-acetyltransferase [Stutzerimonas nitrititolerans]
MELEHKPFRNIDLSDPFFDSLKEGYVEFPEWFARKADDSAYVFEQPDGTIHGFLYLKVEDEALPEINPPQARARRLKVGTMKVNPHGTKMGERFIKKIVDHAVREKTEQIYVTVFEQHEALISLFQRYGFEQIGTKTSHNGTELVLAKNIHAPYVDLYQNYPTVKLGNNRAYILSLRPEWHTRLLPDSILRNETNDIVEDISSANSIHKVYLTGMHGINALRKGDILVIYRTTDNQGPAHYRSVATSIGVVEEYRHLDSFTSAEEFYRYCRPYSVFSHRELEDLWRRRNYPFVFKFMYNLSFKRKVTRAVMIEELGLPGAEQYWGFFQISHDQLRAIADKGAADESLIID